MISMDQNIAIKDSSDNMDDDLYFNSPRSVIIDNFNEDVNNSTPRDADFQFVNDMKKRLSWTYGSDDNGVDMECKTTLHHQHDKCTSPKIEAEAEGTNPGESIMDNIFWIIGSLESLRNSWRVNERNRRISESLYLLKQAQRDLEISRSPENIKLRTDNLNILGDLGVALFSPLDAAFGYDSKNDNAIENSNNDRMDKEKDSANDTDFVTSSELDGDGVNVPVIIARECADILLDSPHILSLSLMQKISDEALPAVLQGMTWKRLYSLSRDGDAFQTFLRNVRYHSNTLIIVRTTNDDIFGGLVDSEWEERKNSAQKNYFGTGRSFLFSVSQDSTSHYRLITYRWSGENNYNQICDASEHRIAIGGGGGFGLCLQDNFARGSTEHCATFCNDPLVPDRYFEVLELEVFGFVNPWKF